MSREPGVVGYGHHPCVVLKDVSWQTYQALLRDLGNHRLDITVDPPPDLAIEVILRVRRGVDLVCIVCNEKALYCYAKLGIIKEMLKSMNINLSPQLVELIQQQIHSGEFETVDQTIEAALYLLDKRTKYNHWVEETRKEIDVAAAELDAGEGIRGEEAIAQLRDKLHNTKESF